MKQPDVCGICELKNTCNISEDDNVKTELRRMDGDYHTQSLYVKCMIPPVMREKDPAEKCWLIKESPLPAHYESVTRKNLEITGKINEECPGPDPNPMVDMIKNIGKSLGMTDADFPFDYVVVLPPRNNIVPFPSLSDLLPPPDIA
jgi:hypothetical protein